MTNNKMYGAVLVFLGIIIILIFTKGQIEKFNLLRTENKVLLTSNKEKKSEQNKLNSINGFLTEGKKIEEVISENTSLNKEKLEKMKIDVPKYKKEIKEDEILYYIYELIGKTRSSSIKNLSISSGIVGQMQFLESDINLNVEVPNEVILKNLLTKLYNSEEYKFFIPSLDYKENEQNSGENQKSLQVQIPLKVYYK